MRKIKSPHKAGKILKFYGGSNNSNIDVLLSRLEKVKSNGSSKWLACCPAHDDKSPSLSIRDAGDRVLLHCFGGCSVYDICAAIGMGVHDLFAGGKAPHEIIPGVLRRDFIDTLLIESLICEIAASDLACGKKLSESEINRMQLARKFVSAARGVPNV